MEFKLIKSRFGIPKRLLLFLMRIFIFFMSMTLFALSPNNTLGQEKVIVKSSKERSIDEVFDIIKRQTKYHFIYEQDLTEKVPNAYIEKGEILVSDLLKRILSNANYEFSVSNGNTIMVKQENLKKPNQELIISGKVVDENGLELPGVTVVVNETSNGTYTDIEGNYSLKVNNASITLVFSAMGFKDKKVNVQEGQFEINVVLIEDVSTLDEVLVTAYGKTTQRKSTGSIAKVTSKQIETQTVLNPLEALKGQVAGLTISQSSGLPGSGMRVNIRGINSLVGSTTPLYVINGVPYSGDPVTLSSNSIQNVGNPAANSLPLGANTQDQFNATGESPLNFINPLDIESIEVLKDADATALYGSRAANGVIMITTKRGKAGRATLNVTAYTGVGEIAKDISLLNTDEYLALRESAFESDGIAPDEFNAPDLALWDPTSYTNFQKKLAGETVVQQNINTSLSGGNENVSFLVSGTFDKRTTVYDDDTGSKRISFNSDLGYESSAKNLKLNVSTIYTSTKTDLPGSDYYSLALNLPPNYPLYDEDGGINYTRELYNIINPLNYTYTDYSSSTNNLVSNFNLTYNILPNIIFRANLGYNLVTNQSNYIQYSRAVDPSYRDNDPIYTRQSENISNNILAEPQIEFKKSFNAHDFRLLLGTSFQQNDNEQPYFIYASNYTSDALVNNLNAAGNYTIRNSKSEYRYQSLFARLTYDYNSKYIVNLNFRRDGSSLFGEDNRFGNFGSVAGAWIFSEEKFIKDNFTWFNYGKFRASYGIVGSDNATGYAYVPLYGASDFNYSGYTALQPIQIANPDYKWEATKKLEIAFETGLFDNNLLFTAAWYRNRSDNQLVQYPLSGQTGFDSYQANMPALIQNSGLEFTLGSTIIRTDNFSWKANFNASMGRNKLVKFDNIENTPYANRYIVGESLSSVYGYIYDGIDDETKLPTVKDLNEDGYISTGLYANNASGDREKIGNGFPKLTGGLSSSIKYKNLQLDFLFQFVSGHKNYSLTNDDLFGTMNNVYTAHYNELKGLYANEEDFNLIGTDSYGSIENYYKYIALFYYNSSNEGYLEDASYIRLQNVNLSYSFPKSLCNKIGFNMASIYLRGQNLFTLTNYEGADPETGGATMPPLRTFALGLQFNL